MTAFAARLPGLRGLASIGAQSFYVYRADFAFQLLGVLLQISLLKVVWTAVYADAPGGTGTDLQTLVSYLTIVNLQIWLLSADIARSIHQRVREGAIALDLARPIGLLSQFASLQLGRTAAAFLLAVAALPLAFVLGGLRFPRSPEAALVYGVSLVLAYTISLLISLLLGLIAFWTYETTGVLSIYRFVNLFLGGGLVPLWLFPDWLRAVAELLPFQAQGYVPVSIYLGRIAGPEMLQSLAVQSLWVAGLATAVQALWGRAVRRIVIQGG